MSEQSEHDRAAAGRSWHGEACASCGLVFVELDDADPRWRGFCPRCKQRVESKP